jgi:hypothetical protein
MIETMKLANLAVRFLLELCALAAMGYWGYRTGNGHVMKIIMCVGAPLIAAVAWGVFVSPKASIPTTGWLHLLLELCFFGSAVVALNTTGHKSLAEILGIVAAVNLTLIYVWKQ